MGLAGPTDSITQGTTQQKTGGTPMQGTTQGTSQSKKIRGIEYVVIRYIEWFGILIALGSVLTESQQYGQNLFGFSIQSLVSEWLGAPAGQILSVIQLLCLTVGPMAVSGKGFAQSQWFWEERRNTRRKRVRKSERKHQAEDARRFFWLSFRSFLFALFAVSATGWFIFCSAAGFGDSGTSRTLNQLMTAGFIATFLIFFLAVNKTIPLPDDTVSTKVDKMWTIAQVLAWLGTEDKAERDRIKKRVTRVCVMLARDETTGVRKDEVQGWLIPEPMFRTVVDEATKTSRAKPRTNAGQTDPAKPEISVIELDTRRTNPTLSIVKNGTDGTKE